MTALTIEEIKFLIDLLGRLTVSPASPEAAATVAIVQSIVAKLSSQQT